MICNRCMNTNALINQAGDLCTSCGHPFVRNFTGFDTLPLVEFVPRSEIPPKKVMEFLKMDPPEEGSGFQPQKNSKKPAKGGFDGWQQENKDEQTMQFGQNDDLENDLFTNRMLEWLESQVNPD